LAKIKILRDPVESSRGSVLITTAKSSHQGNAFFKISPSVSQGSAVQGSTFRVEKSGLGSNIGCGSFVG
jgi:hypothetical protein